MRFASTYNDRDNIAEEVYVKQTIGQEANEFFIQ